MATHSSPWGCKELDTTEATWHAHACDFFILRLQDGVKWVQAVPGQMGSEESWGGQRQAVRPGSQGEAGMETRGVGPGVRQGPRPGTTQCEASGCRGQPPAPPSPYQGGVPALTPLNCPRPHTPPAAASTAHDGCSSRPFISFRPCSDALVTAPFQGGAN